MGDEGFQQLVQTVSSLSHLYRCGTTGNRLGDEGFQQLVQTVSSLSHLAVLDVSCNGLTEQSLHSLAAVLKTPSSSALQVGSPVGDGIRVSFLLCLQCFDAVGWAAGRASSL